jgi:hypothetical protein
VRPPPVACSTGGPWRRLPWRRLRRRVRTRLLCCRALRLRFFHMVLCVLSPGKHAVAEVVLVEAGPEEVQNHGSASAAFSKHSKLKRRLKQSCLCLLREPSALGILLLPAPSSDDRGLLSRTQQCPPTRFFAMK